MRPPRLRLSLPATRGGRIHIDAAATSSYLLPSRQGDGELAYFAGLAEGLQTTLGGTFLRAHITVFDRAQGQIGFVPHLSCAPLEA
ncbi:MAG: hypothetical protein EOO40_08730 [Deltaproteobacteria bacterium]|nr:MAG: hypothetical protein EOO40_08730 [Deltaproteobacteria bacterium]